MGDVVQLETLKEFIDNDNYIVLVDSCVFLDYYRYSSETASAILNNLEHLEGYLWLPNQVYKEFKRNYKTVLNPNHNKYKNITKDISSITKKFKNSLDSSVNQYNKFNFPKISELREKIYGHLEQVQSEVKEYSKEIKREIDENSAMMKSNKMLTFMEKLKDNNQVGGVLSPSRILEITQEGEQRFKLNLPPGYEDGDKSDDPIGPYGDLIVWKNLIEYAQQEKVNIVFTTSDSKPDWWILDETSDEIIAPREELIAEFNESITNDSKLLMLPMKEFIKHFSIINNISSVHVDIELNARAISKEELLNFSEKIEEELVHQAFHIHLGNIQAVDDFEIISVEVANIDIEFDEDNANLSGVFLMEASGFFEEYINKEFSEANKATIELKGEFSIELKMNFEEYDYEVLDINLLDLEIQSSYVHYEEDETEYFEMCDVCRKSVAEYDLYSDERICEKCSKDSSSYFLCTNCSTFYRHEEYNGDGERCIRCN